MDKPTRVLIILLILYGILAYGGCTQIEITINKNVDVSNSKSVDVDYTTTGKIDSVAELDQEVSDLIDATIPLK